MDVHIVVKGDTLWKIARQYGIPFEDLKRVNAHLANPDYIVPGMKIFLPKKKASPPSGGKGKEKMPEKVKPQPSAPKPAPTPTPSKPPAMEKPSPPKQPIPLPEFEMPKPPSVPKQPLPIPPSPPVQQPKPPAEPMPTVPPAAPTPPMAMPPFFQPIMPVPCGWMPIYDADCVPMPMPMPFPGFPQQMPMPAPSMPQVMPTPEMSMPPAQMGVKPPEIDMSDELDDYDESPIYPGRGPGASPPYPVRGWELMESPMMPEESPDQMVYCPPEQGYVPQMVSPEFQNPNWMMQPQMPFGFCQPCQPVHHHCGCPSHGFHGGGQHEMYPNYPNQMMPMQMMPMHMNPMQMSPMQMFPGQNYPAQAHPSQMYPAQQMYPMHMQPFQSTDNRGCGC